MKRSIRRISALLAFAVVLSLFAAFPAISVGAEDTNIAPLAQYKGEGIDNGTSGNYCDSPVSSWATYHSGKLTDGVIPEGDSYATMGSNVEFYLESVTPGIINVFFKFNGIATVSTVNVYMNDRENNAKCGYPTKIDVFVGDSEDVATATLLGEATTTDPEGAVRKYTVSGEALSGSYVIVQFTAGEQCRITCSEVEIMGSVAAEESTPDETTPDETTPDETTSDDTTSEDTSSDESSDDSSSDDPSDETVEIDDMALENVAGDAEYKGTEGDDNGTSGNYCDIPIGEWLNFHTGKLNDGVIPEGDSSATKGQNVEIWNAAQAAGNNTVIFKLAETTDVKKVNVYMNNRTDNANTGYPEKIEIYVGDSEDMATATLMGEAVTTDPEGAVRKHTVSGNVSGQYVFIYFTIGAKWRITLSEVEIMTDGTPVNQAPNAQYKGEGDDNGTTGSYCEVGAEWNEYHTGKLNDGTIATDASNAVTGVNVEFYNAGFAVGTNTLTFKFDYEVYVSNVVAYFNTRNNSANRGYPSKVLVYVGDSEDVATATLLGEATTTDEGYVRAYSVSGGAKGTYVIFKMDISNPVAVIALTEVEINGFGTPAEPVLPSLDAPVLSGNLTQMETFDAPVITWEAVEGATSYDAYIDGILVTEGITDTSYIPVMDSVITYGSNSSYTTVQIVAKGDGVTTADSALSESYNFFYVTKPVDLRGNSVTSADILIDPGHGGSQPGAVGVYADGSERQEKVDTLNMSLKLGEYFEKLGYTVAYTRITDSDVGLMARAAMANAGTFRAYICVHRNSFSDARANGIETLYETGDANDQALAQSIQDAMMELGGFTNRGLKPRDNLVVLNNTTAKTPLCLVELAFISNENDNNMFDEKFDALALAIVKGTMSYLGDDPSAAGKVTVDGTDYEYNGEELEINIDITVGDVVDTKIAFELISRLGITKIVGMDEDGTIAVEIDVALDAETNVATAEDPIGFVADAVGTYSGTYAYIDDFGNICKIATVTYTASEYAYALGDVNEDGYIDNLDAVAILKYDAGITNDELKNADVNKDGYVDNLDAVMILKYDAGIIDSIE